MKRILVGQIVNTHGLKGELRIISNFPYKELVFTKGFKVYVGKRNDLCVINSYRKHKIYDMVALANKIFDNICKANIANALSLSKYLSSIAFT